MIRTLQVGEGWFPHAPGGLTRYYYDMLHHLPAAGVAAHGLVVGPASSQLGPTSPQALADEPRVLADGRVHAFAAADAPLLTRWRAARGAGREAIARCDMVASHFALYGLPLLDSLAGKPLVTHFHGPWAAESGVEDARAHPAKRAIEWAVYRRSRRLIVLSEAFKQVLVSGYGVREDRVHVVPGGIEAAHFACPLTRTQARAALGWPSDRPIALSVRRLTRRMGLERLVEATAAARRRVPDLLVMIAGTGPLAGALADQVAEAGLGQHVRLLGRLPDAALPLAYRAADVGVVPTLALEGFGLVVAEALAAGLPSLVTPVGGLPEVVAGLDPALVLPGGSAAAIADGLASALTGAWRLPDAARCQAHARAHFDWAVVRGRLRHVYEAALAA